MYSTYTKSLRCLTIDELVQLLVCHPILQGIHLLRYEQSRTHLSVRERLVILSLSIKSFYALACSWFVTFRACVLVITPFCYLNLCNVCTFYVIKFFQLRFSLLRFI